MPTPPTAMTTATEACETIEPLTSAPAMGRRLLAIGISAALHLAVLAGGVVSEAMREGFGGNNTNLLPQQPLLLVAVALVMAHNSIGGLWWASARWSMAARTALAVVGC